MAIHDRRYKRVLTSAIFAYEMAQVLADAFNLGTVDRRSLQPEPTSSVKETSRERITDSAWAFDTDRQPTVMMIVEAQSSREYNLELRLARYVLDRLLELSEARRRGRRPLPPVVVAVLYTGADRWRPPALHDLFSPLAQALMRFEFPVLYYDVLHMEPEEEPASRLLRMVFQVERCGDPGETVPVLEAIRDLEDRDTYELLLRFLADKMRLWDRIHDEQGRVLLDAGQLDDSRPLSEVVREMETVQERFFRQIAEGRAEGQVVGMLLSFRRALDASGLDSRLTREVEAHVDRILEAVRHGVRFDLDDIPDGVRLLIAIRDGGGPEQVPAERIWGLLPHIPEEDDTPK